MSAERVGKRMKQASIVATVDAWVNKEWPVRWCSRQDLTPRSEPFQGQSRAAVDSSVYYVSDCRPIHRTIRLADGFPHPKRDREY